MFAKRECALPETGHRDFHRIDTEYGPGLSRPSPHILECSHPMNFDSILWFGISGGTLAFAISLLWQRYVKKTPHAMQSRGSFLMFAILSLIFSVGAFFAGLFTI
jgi:hypothetical protein